MFTSNSQRRPRRLVWVVAGVLLVVGLGSPPTIAAAAAPLRDAVKLPCQRVPLYENTQPPRGWRGDLTFQQYQREYRRRFHQIESLLGERKVSRKSHELLRRRGLGPALLAGAESWKRPPAELAVDTLTVLLVRISFETDRSGDLTSVTTDGNFRLEQPDSSQFFDPPPHNRSFYETHLLGLSDYYRMQSGGRLFIRGGVFPAEENSSYQLSDLADYGPGEDQFWTIDSLERLVRDMIGAADAGLMTSDGISLADYDDDDPFTYVIFIHAGSDWQSDVYADSPNDVPTFFVSLGDPEALTSIDGDTGLPGSLTECSVIPETINQDDALGSIAAALYHEFGHALGLVDIYSTRSGLPQVGVWSLMDSGTNLGAFVGLPHPTEPDSFETKLVIGLLPPSLCAWDKWFLGWLDVVYLQDGPGEYRLPAVQVPRTADEYDRYRSWGYDFRLGYPQAAIGGVSPREFFLVENRWVPANPGAPNRPGMLPEETGVGLVRDAATGVIVWLGGDPDPDTGVPRNTGMYDIFLPSLEPLEDGYIDHTGLLIWHVNMARIEANLATNTINAWGDGLRLVEADGISDIGSLEPYFMGWLGSYRDPFNEINGDALYLEGAPSSRAFDRSWTGLGLSGIQGVDVARAVMSCEVELTPLTSSSPFVLAAIDSAEAGEQAGQAGPRALAPHSATPWTVQDGATQRPVLCVAGTPRPDWDGDLFQPKLFVWRLDGSPAATPGETDWPIGAAWQFTARLAGPPVVINLGAPPMPPYVQALVAGLADGKILAFDSVLGPGNVLQATWGPVAVGDSLAYAPAPGSMGQMLCAVPPDSLVLMANVGELLGDPLLLVDGLGVPISGFAAPPLWVNLPVAPHGGGWIVFAPDAWYLVSADNDGLVAAPERYGHGLSLTDGQGLQRAWLPAEGGGTLLLFASEQPISAWAIAGSQVSSVGWPHELEADLVAEPAVADLDGNGTNDLVLLTGSRVHAIHADGMALTGFPVQLSELFPLADSTRIAGSSVVCDSDGDGYNELFFCTDLGHLMSLDARGSLRARFPFLWGAGGQAGLVVGEGADASERTLWLLDGGGRRGPPLQRRWHNGRVVGYRLLGSGTAVTSTEWLGASGSTLRLGPAGTSSSLAGPAPWRSDIEPVVFYPNPLTGTELTVRFYSQTDRPARLVIYNLEGEVVARASIPTQAGSVNEFPLTLPGLASGLYVCQLERETAAGIERTVGSLAVAR